jgi:hypothetical protein
VSKSLVAEFPFNEDLKRAKSQSKEDIIEIEKEQNRQEKMKEGLASVL